MNTIIEEDVQKMTQAHLPWESLDGKTVLITGATGMLASYVTWLLLYLHRNRNVNVNVLALCRTKETAEKYFGDYWGEPYFRLLIQDVCSPIDYDGDIHYIFHLAGNASPHFINSDPVGIMRCNLLGTINVLQLAHAKGNAKVIFASTREVYGRNDAADTLDEQSFGVIDTLDSRSCYPESKRAAETLLKSFSLQYGVPFNTIRIAHSYGPMMRLFGDGRIMADLMANVVEGSDIILKSDGSAVRAFIYETDAVLGICYIVWWGDNNKAYNLANETEPITIKDLARMMATLRHGLQVSMQISATGNQGYCAYKRKALDTSAVEALGWSPMVSLQNGIHRTFLSKTVL